MFLYFTASYNYLFETGKYDKKLGRWNQLIEFSLFLVVKFDSISNSSGLEQLFGTYCVREPRYYCVYVNIYL